MKIFDESYSGLIKAMDLSYKRHMLLASNIANSETPNFRARELDFGGELDKALGAQNSDLKTADSRHFTGSGELDSSHIVYDNIGEVGADGNNVDLDIQMGKISTNGEMYQDAISFVSTKLRILRSAFNRGGA